VKVLTLTQPWATLIAVGAKRIETRSWSTPYRGPIAIHAGKGFPRWAQAMCVTHPFLATLIEAGIDRLAELPRGVIVCTATLTAVDGTDSCNCRAWLRRGPAHESDFGDYAAGRFAWRLGDVQALATPVGHRGSQGLRDLPDDVAARCRSAIA